jgi:hypothetical protein
MKSIKVTLPILYLLTFFLFLFTFFWGYCWNWWAQNQLWQFLFQPLCPMISEEARYPQNIDVLVSARYFPSGGSVLPGGRTIRYGMWGQGYLYDFETKSSEIISPLPENHSLRGYATEEWVFTEVESVNETDRFVLVNLNTDEQIPLINIPLKQDDKEEYYIDINIINLLQHHLVFMKNGYAIFSLTTIGDANAKHYIISSNRSYSANLVHYLKKNGVYPINLDTHYSPDARSYYQANYGSEFSTGIYDSTTHQPNSISFIFNAPPSGWAYKGQGVVLTQALYICVLPFIICFAYLPQPILLLRQDPQYLPPDIQAQFATQDKMEAQNKTMAAIVMVGLIVASIGSIGLIIRTHRRFNHHPLPVQRTLLP